MEALNELGFGVAKSEGAVFFVRHAVPGDRIRAKVIKAAKNYYVARIDEILAPSPDRTEPDCPYFKRCGGCGFWNLNYEAEEEWKRRFVSDAFRRFGLFPEILPVLSNGAAEAYRNKAQFPLTEIDGNTAFGFYSGKSHKVCPIKACRIQDPVFSQIALFACAYFKDQHISVYEEETGKGLVRHLYLRRAKSTGEISLCLVLTKNEFPNPSGFLKEIQDRFPQIVSVSFNLNPKNTNVILGDKTVFLTERQKIRDRLLEKVFFISPLSFYQVNHDMAEILYQTAYQLAGLNENSILIDLYCGIGTVSLSYPGKVKKIYGVEVIEEAVKDARENAKINGVQNAEFFCGDAGDLFQKIGVNELKNTIVFVDPPRKGLSEKLILDLIHKNIPKIVYISCNPETLARDLKLFSENGYHFSAVQPVDLFPRTGHVETVVRLSRQ